MLKSFLEAALEGELDSYLKVVRDDEDYVTARKSEKYWVDSSMFGKNRTILINAVLVLVLSLILTFPTKAQAPHRVKDTLSARYSYIKFSVLPFLYEALRTDGGHYIWITLQYESQFNLKSKFTYNLVLDYLSFGPFKGNLTLNGGIEFYARPQVRFYIRKAAYKGYYIGVFPLYEYRGGEFVTPIGSYWGGGIIAGYQFFVRKKVPIEINISYGVRTGMVSVQDYNQGPYYTVQDTYRSGLIELNIGLPIRKKQ